MTVATKTINPLHFEDLEPHKFEDVVRGLLYDFRDWQVIEPTGKGGNDDGYDARGWEKVKIIENEDEDTKEKGQHPMEGNRWMIQSKREKTITPKKIESILDDVDANNPPYGYILAAPVTFSKESHDVFRDILLKKGVTEFYLWGRDYLEDQLYLPKNDHILFTTFGFSLNTRKRSKKTETKFAINNKNKIFKIWGKPELNYLKSIPVLIRDFNDESYPFQKDYVDFERNPHWIECEPFAYHPLGLWVHLNSYYAYTDLDKKEFDFYKKTDLLYRRSDARTPKSLDIKHRLQQQAMEFWERLPIKNQSKLSIDGLVYFKDMLIVDDKGDTAFDFPHIFVEFRKDKGRIMPFGGYRHTIKIDNTEFDLDNKFQRIKIFPNKMPKYKLGTIHDEKLNIPYESLNFFTGNRVGNNGFIFDFEDKYNFLKKGDIGTIPNTSNLTSSISNEDRYFEVTQVYKTTVKEFFKNNSEYPQRTNMDLQNPGREIKDSDNLTVLEVRSIYKNSFIK